MEATGKRLTFEHNGSLPIMRNQSIMETLSLQSFSEFESWVEELRSRQLNEQETSQINYCSDLLFRGHSDEKWRLQTTLERYSSDTRSLSEYLYKAHRVKLDVELHTGKKWGPILKDGLIIKNDNFRAPLPSIEYLVYLRHHGFPSPLLDWTRSPYIAALFAYSGIGDDTKGNIAIFVYQEYAGSPKRSSSGDPFIQTIGPYIDTHKRHSIQQAEYTLCYVQSSKSTTQEYFIHPHDECPNLGNQDRLYKITLPKSEKLKILSKLNQFNLNLYSIYGSEESLMSTLALSEFHLNK